jgi:L-ascorbate metabolism protein UlaG (beta-lactamase superfamily)
MDESRMTTAERLTYIGHATVLLETNGLRLLTDPVLRGRVAHLRRHGPLSAQGWRGHLDAVLLSHLHLDHFDLPSLRRLGKGTRLIVPPGAGLLLQRRGFTEVEELAAGATTTIGAVPITATGASHSGFRPPLGPTAAAIGFLIGARRRIYFPGDTDLFPAMADLAADLDVALLPVWGWGPTLGPGHLDPERAAEALRLLRPRRAVPIHWGTLYPLGWARGERAFLTDPPHRFARHAASVAPEVEVTVVPPGGHLELAH